jgi:hypothetical protein
MGTPVEQPPSRTARSQAQYALGACGWPGWATVQNGKTIWAQTRTTVNRPQELHGSRWSLRVSVVAFVVIIVIFFAVAVIFLFVFFLVWLLSKEDIGSYRPIRRVRVEAFWMYAAHAQW